MKYKTTIHITTEAADKSEALELVGEYLSGNLVSGIEMKCHTAPNIRHKARVVALTAFSFLVIITAFLAGQVKSSASLIQTTSGISAIQPPLRTSSIESQDADFKKDWQNRQTKKALEYIKQ